MYKHSSFTSVIFCSFIIIWMSQCRADDIVVQMFSKQQLNQISDKFISYSIDPSELLELSKEENSLYRMMEMGPCYLKIYGNHTNRPATKTTNETIDLSTPRFSIDRFRNVYDALRSAGIKPVVALPYNSNNWKIRNVIRILAKFSEMNLNNIVWQLGSDFNTENTINYIDDLNTLKLIVNTFSTEKNNKNWSVVGADIMVGSNANEARIYSEFSKHIVDAVGWSQSIELNYSDENVDDFFSGINIEPALRTILNGDVPAWLSLQQKNAEQKNPLKQMKQGLNWAQTLGDAAKNGFKVIYLPLDKNNWMDSPTLSYYTTLLHKRIIGQTVFDTKMFNGNRFDSHFYAHCTKNMSGSFTLFGVNAGDSRLDITAKLPFRSGTEFMEFILTVSVNGRIHLNGHEIIEPSILTPVPKYKLPGKATQLSMPANSIAFWVFTAAKIPECESIETIKFDMNQNRQSTSSERLLQELIIETVQRDQPETEVNSIRRLKNEIVTRHRRDADTTTTTINGNNSNNKNNRIVKRSEYNAINLITDNDQMQMRSKRFIRGGKIINRIYNEIDDMKRRQLASPNKNIFNGFKATKRSKRDVGMLKNLFEKFDLKKPIFNLKPPTFKLGAQSIIPPISAIHDIFNPENTERKLFDPVENPNLPAGDIHFALAEAATETISNMNQANRAPEIIYGDDVVVSPEMNPQPDINNQFGSIFEMNQPALNDGSSMGVPASALLEELTAIEVNPVPAPVTTIDKSPIQHNIPFVVKALPPTWQQNQDNMEKARNNLQQLYWPITNAQNANPKITSLLPNVAHIQLPQQDEHVLYETRRRRRRAIDSRMNEEIENRIQRMAENTNDFTDRTKNAELLDKISKIIDSMERSQAIDGLNRKKNPLNRLLAVSKNGINEPTNGNDIQKKCKILSMATEQQCLQVETQPKFLFKRQVNGGSKVMQTKPIGPLKKLFGTIKETVEKRNSRLKRDTDTMTVSESKENFVNTIPRNVEQKKRPLLRYSEKIQRKNTNNMDDDDATMDPTEIIDNDIETNSKKDVPKLLRIVKSSVDKVMSAVTSRVASWWHSMSLPLND